MGVSRNVVAENTRLQVLAQRFQFGDLSEQFDFLCTVRQLRHAALGRADLAHDAGIKQSDDQFGRVPPLLLRRLAQLRR